jgi:predicted P-loop ATPase
MLPFAAVEAARDAIWARAMAEYRAGTCWHTVTDEFKRELRERNEDHTVTDPWSDQVAEFLDLRQKAMDLPVTIPDLMGHLKLESSQRNNAAAVRLVELTTALGWFKGKLRPAPGMPQRQGLWPRDKK